MSDEYTIHNEVGLHFVTFTVVNWIAGPEVLWCWIEKSNQLTRHGYEYPPTAVLCKEN
jgi:hypothetical protein